MKKFLYLFLFFTLFLLFNMQVSALTYDTLPTYIGSIDNCAIGGTSFISSDYNVLVYRIDVTSDYNSVEIPLTFYSGTRLVYRTSSTLYNTCSSTPDFYNYSGQGNDTYYSPVINNTYTYQFLWGGPRPDATFPIYVYMYLGDSGRTSWGTQLSPEPEPEPELVFDDLIFVPESDTYNQCYVVQNEDVIRAYNIVPTLSTNYSYRDYYINSSYIYKDGIGSWSQYSTLPICLDSDKITHDFYYRLDFDKICIIFITLVLFGILLPIKIFSKILFGKAGL